MITWILQSIGSGIGAGTSGFLKGLSSALPEDAREGLESLSSSLATDVKQYADVREELAPSRKMVVRMQMENSIAEEMADVTRDRERLINKGLSFD